MPLKRYAIVCVLGFWTSGSAGIRTSHHWACSRSTGSMGRHGRTDAPWAVIQPLPPERPPGPGHKRADDRPA